MTEAPAIDILTVSFRSAPFLNLAKECLDYFNPELNYKWFIGRNDEAETASLRGFKTVDGISRKQIKRKRKNQRIGEASYAHSLCLNKLIKRQRARFALILDPDFYIFQSLTPIIDYMISSNLTFWGCPYIHSKKFNRILNFPVAFCMLIDFDKIEDKSQIDFVPIEKKSKFYSDTGFKIYHRFTKPKMSKWDIAVPYLAEPVKDVRSTSKTIKEWFPYESRFDEYYWKDHLFGIHAHMKTHLLTSARGKKSKLDRQTDEQYQRKKRKWAEGSFRKNYRRNRIQLREIREIFEKIKCGQT